MKNNISYFSHDCDSSAHAKFIYLRGEYGWEGEGRFWALNGIIGMAGDCMLDLRVMRNKAAIAEKLGMSITEFDKFIDFLLSKDCELLYAVDGCITTDRCQETLEEVQYNRKTARERKARKQKSKQTTQEFDEPTRTPEKLSNNSPELNNNSSEKTPNSPIKERKGKESKVEKSISTGVEGLESVKGMPFLELKELCRQYLHKDAPDAPLLHFEELEFKKLYAKWGEEKLYHGLQVATGEKWNSLVSVESYLEGKLKPKNERYTNNGKAPGEYASRVGFTVGPQQLDNLSNLHRELEESDKRQVG